ncbi:DUF4224 domain-containing protein [Paraburkholderia sp. RL17-373-BIF-A]|uniref:DUF4224 domain-containing protein n=1 Tax=Paraburkholderia sp. RL17-373-BIF-A TaxID=3031629 RepID=UPI0038B6B317
MFLSTQELVQLTGRKVKKKQIEALRRMGLPFFVNALGRPVVARAAVEGSRQGTSERVVRASWQPRVVAN